MTHEEVPEVKNGDRHKTGLTVQNAMNSKQMLRSFMSTGDETVGIFLPIPKATHLKMTLILG